MTRLFRGDESEERSRKDEANLVIENRIYLPGNAMNCLAKFRESTATRSNGQKENWTSFGKSTDLSGSLFDELGELSCGFMLRQVK